MARDQQGNLHPMNSCCCFKGTRAFLLAQLNFLHVGNLFFTGTHTPLPLSSHGSSAQLPQENVPLFWLLFLPFVSQRKTTLMMKDRFKVVPGIHSYEERKKKVLHLEVRVSVVKNQ